MAEYAVLLSNATRASRDDLVEPERFSSPVKAAHAGHDTARAGGVLYTVAICRETEGCWMTLWGASVEDALRDFDLPSERRRWWS